MRETVPWCGCPAPQVLSSGGMPNPLHDRLSPALNHLTLWGIRYTPSIIKQFSFEKGNSKDPRWWSWFKLPLGHWVIGSSSPGRTNCIPKSSATWQRRDGKPQLTAGKIWKNPSYAVGLEVPKNSISTSRTWRPKQIFHSFSVETSVWGWKWCAPRIQWFIILHPQHSSQSLGQDSRPHRTRKALTTATWKALPLMHQGIQCMPWSWATDGTGKAHSYISY